jgi:hypothetical protein
MNNGTRPGTIRLPYGHRILSLGAAALLTVLLHLPGNAGDQTAGGKRLPAFPGAEGSACSAAAVAKEKCTSSPI